MQALATFIMRGHLQALLVAVGLGVLSLMFPPLGYFSSGAVGLVTLRRGPVSGLLVVAGAGLATGLIALVAVGTAWPGLLFVAIAWLPVWLLGLVLRRSISLTLTLQVAGLLAALVVAGFYLLLDDPASWWQAVLKEIFEPALAQTAQDPQTQALIETGFAEAARVLSGSLAAALMLNTLLSLFLARWWQALLYNPGGFQAEMHGLRLGKVPAVLAVLLLLPVALGAASGVSVNVLIVVVALFALQGLALIHAIVALKRMHVAWLGLLYIVMIFALPQLGMLLGVLGFVDCWIDIRSRLARSAAGA